jgi:hypothetical protein
MHCANTRKGWERSLRGRGVNCCEGYKLEAAIGAGAAAEVTAWQLLGLPRSVLVSKQ